MIGLQMVHKVEKSSPQLNVLIATSTGQVDIVQSETQKLAANLSWIPDKEEKPSKVTTKSFPDLQVEPGSTLHITYMWDKNNKAEVIYTVKFSSQLYCRNHFS